MPPLWVETKKTTHIFLSSRWHSYCILWSRSSFGNMWLGIWVSHVIHCRLMWISLFLGMTFSVTSCFYSLFFFLLCKLACLTLWYPLFSGFVSLALLSGTCLDRTKNWHVKEMGHNSPVFWVLLGSSNSVSYFMVFHNRMKSTVELQGLWSRYMKPSALILTTPFLYYPNPSPS